MRKSHGYGLAYLTCGDQGGGEISVVHVDDEPDVGSLVAAFLERYDDRLSVATATGVDAALDRLTADVDCIVSDYEMPGTDGIEFLEDRAGFYVEDDGLGISGHERSRIFQSGYSTSADGTGFGLSIVHVIVAAHDWEITVTDGASGGTRFEITGLTIVE